MSREKQISETRSRVSKSKWKRASKSTRVLRVLSLLGRKEHQHQREESAKDRDDERKTLENGRSIDRRTLGYLHHLLYSDDAGPPTPKALLEYLGYHYFKREKEGCERRRRTLTRRLGWWTDGRRSTTTRESSARKRAGAFCFCLCEE